MSDREEKLARNEATAREINEELEEAQSADTRSPYLRIACECGNLECDGVIAITKAEYEHVRSDPVRFVVLAGHIDPDMEAAVDETDRFVVVAKREGTPAEIAVEEDPRG
jgi:hypothetical protein